VRKLFDAGKRDGGGEFPEFLLRQAESADDAPGCSPFCGHSLNPAEERRPTMADSTKHCTFSPRRRRTIQAGAALVSGALLPGLARAQQADLGPYQQAKINWRQAEGEAITVAVIPASYFENLIVITPQFEALTGIKVRYDKVPPGQIRQKAMLDLTSKTATYATSATDPMYYPLYASNKWVDPLDSFIGDSSLTDPNWFRYDDLLKAWRDADSVDGKPYGIPYDGEVTVQVYRKDLYDAKGLKPADTLEEYLKNAQAVHDPANRVWGAAMRGFAGAGQNMYIYPSIFRSFGGDWFSGGRIRVNGPEAIAALDWYVDALSKYAPAAVRNWNWPDIADAFAQGTLGVYVDAHSSAAVLNNPGEIEGHRENRLCPLAERTNGQARDFDLELGIPGERGPFAAREACDLALHQLGRFRRDARRGPRGSSPGRRSAPASIARRCGATPTSSA
jgi:ABC-type glycerol-3-phosphate transport system substrate-binding protein